MPSSFSLRVYPDRGLNLIRARVEYKADGVNHPAPLVARFISRSFPTDINTTVGGKGTFIYGNDGGERVKMKNPVGNRPLLGLLAFHDGPKWRATADWYFKSFNAWPGIHYDVEATVFDAERAQLSGTLKSGYAHWNNPSAEKLTLPLQGTTLQVVLQLPGQNSLDGLPITPPISGNVLLDPKRVPAPHRLMTLILDHVKRRDPYATLFSPRLTISTADSYWPNTARHRIDAYTRRLAATDAALAYNTLVIAESGHDNEAPLPESGRYQFDKPLQVAKSATDKDPDALHGHMAQAKAHLLLGNRLEATAAMGNLLGRLACLDAILARCGKGVYTILAREILEQGWSRSGWQAFFIGLSMMGFRDHADQRMLPHAFAVELPVLPLDDD